MRFDLWFFHKSRVPLPMSNIKIFHKYFVYRDIHETRFFCSDFPVTNIRVTIPSDWSIVEYRYIEIGRSPGNFGARHFRKVTPPLLPASLCMHVLRLPHRDKTRV